MNLQIISAKRFLLAAAALCFLAIIPVAGVGDDEVLPPGKKNPVLLIHGLGSDSLSWNRLPELLEAKGYTVFVLDFNSYTWMENADDPHKLLGDLCAVLSKKLEEIYVETNRGKINIVAHSYGGIIVRAHIAGFGVTVGQQYGYYNDIGKVVYLGTPHFGTEIKRPMRKLLVADTDYSLFKNENILIDSLVYGSDILNTINRYFAENKEKLQVAELSVSSLGDDLVPGFSANLDSFLVSQEARTSSNPVKSASMHVYLKGYKHTGSEVIGSPGKTLIDIKDSSHPVFKICDSFFSGTKKWQKYNVKNKDDNSFLVIEFIATSGFEPHKLKKANVLLQRYESPSKKTKVRIFTNKSSKAFYAKKMEGGTFALTIPVDGEKKTYKFVYNIAPGSGSILQFNPANPPQDPDNPGGGEEDPGDGKIPNDVTGLKSLTEFVKARYPNEYQNYNSSAEMLDLVRRVRDDLASTYGNIERLNDQAARFDYTADYEKHADAIYLVDSNRVIDFVSGVTAGGILRDKLHWITVQAPW